METVVVTLDRDWARTLYAALHYPSKDHEGRTVYTVGLSLAAEIRKALALALDAQPIE
jgi:hypothetical protein